MRRSMAVMLALALPALPAAAQIPRSDAATSSNPTRARPPTTFRAIAARSRTTARSLDRYLSRGHTLMPDFSLSFQERDALVAYILSLR